MGLSQAVSNGIEVSIPPGLPALLTLHFSALLTLPPAEGYRSIACQCEGRVTVEIKMINLNMKRRLMLEAIANEARRDGGTVGREVWVRHTGTRSGCTGYHSFTARPCGPCATSLVVPWSSPTESHTHCRCRNADLRIDLELFKW